MKKNLLALGMLTTAGLFAQNNNDQLAYNESGYCNTCCCTPCCCKPCCIPKAKKCIDCECYTPQFYDLQCDWGIALDIEFLYWYSREDNLQWGEKYIALQNQAEEIFNMAYPTDYLNFKAAWDPGVRVGIGFNSECDGWDYYLNWTWYRASESKSVSESFPKVYPDPGFTAIFNPWSSGAALDSGNGPAWKSVKAKWRLTLNQIDLEMGRKYWLSRCFAMRPYVGLRGGWTKTNFKTDSFNGNNEPIDYTLTSGDDILETNTELTGQTRNRNKYWGVGLIAGFQPTWYFCSNFALYGNLDAALIWGDFKGSQKTRFIYSSLDFEGGGGGDGTPYLSDTGFISASGSFSRMVPIIDLALGFRWEETWCCDQYRTALDLGWEHHVWFNHGLRRLSTGYWTDVIGGNNFLSNDDIQYDFYTSPTQVISDLTFGGLVVRFRFDF